MTPTNSTSCFQKELDKILHALATARKDEKLRFGEGITLLDRPCRELTALLQAFDRRLDLQYFEFYYVHLFELLIFETFFQS